MGLMVLALVEVTGHRLIEKSFHCLLDFEMDSSWQRSLRLSNSQKSWARQLKRSQSSVLLPNSRLSLPGLPRQPWHRDSIPTRMDSLLAAGSARSDPPFILSFWNPVQSGSIDWSRVTLGVALVGSFELAAASKLSNGALNAGWKSWTWPWYSWGDEKAVLRVMMKVWINWQYLWPIILDILLLQERELMEPNVINIVLSKILYIPVKPARAIR